MIEFIYPLRVYIEDTDYSGIVYHANYLKYFERARSEWAEQSGLGIEWQQAQGVYLIVRHALIDYLKPAQLHQQVEVVTQIVEFRKASLIYDQYLRSKDLPDIILCRGEFKIACVDQNFKPCAIPKFFIETLDGEQA